MGQAGLFALLSATAHCGPGFIATCEHSDSGCRDLADWVYWLQVHRSHQALALDPNDRKSKGELEYIRRLNGH
jgi:hypothetical protein